PRPAHFPVSGLVDDPTATALYTLPLHAALPISSPSAGTIDITTGSNDTSITAGALASGGSADAIAVHAALLADGDTLTLAGPANFAGARLCSAVNYSALMATLAGTKADITSPSA